MKKIFLIFAIIVTAAIAQAQNVTNQTEIKVTAQGRIKIIPDIAVISFGIEIKGEELSKVKEDSDELYQRVLELLKSNQVKQSDIKPKWFSIYSTQGVYEDKTIYTASQTVQVRVRDLSKYENVINELMNAGINRMDYITFETSQDETLKIEARKLAIAEAQKKAKNLADVLKLKVGKLIYISDDIQDYYAYDDYYNLDGEVYVATDDKPTSGKDTAIAPIGIVAQVTIKFLLED